MVPEGGRTRTIHGFVRVRVSGVTRVGGPRDARSASEDLAFLRGRTWRELAAER